jgi:hypothetical protein
MTLKYTELTGLFDMLKLNCNRISITGELRVFISGALKQNVRKKSGI